MEEIAQQYMIDHVTNQVKDELRRAEAIHGGFVSMHEAIAIIREEFLELEREIFWGIQKTKRLDGIRSEAIQLSAMALRLAVMVSHVPKEAYDRQIGPKTDMERRLLDMLKQYVDPKKPHFCEVCYTESKDSPDDCSDCSFKDRWRKALALIEECETQIRSPHVQGSFPCN